MKKKIKGESRQKYLKKKERVLIGHHGAKERNFGGKRVGWREQKMGRVKGTRGRQGRDERREEKSPAKKLDRKKY